MHAARPKRLLWPHGCWLVVQPPGLPCCLPPCTAPPLQLDHVNLFALLAWVKESRILTRLSGYTRWQQEQEQQQGGAVGYHPPAAPPAGAVAAGQGAAAHAEGAQAAAGTQASGHARGGAGGRRGAGRAGEGGSRGGGEAARRGEDRLGGLHAAVGFITALTNADSDGRVIVCAAPAACAPGGQPPPPGGQQTQDQGSLKFVLLNAAAHFAQVGPAGCCAACYMPSSHTSAAALGAHPTASGACPSPP